MEITLSLSPAHKNVIIALRKELIHGNNISIRQPQLTFDFNVKNCFNDDKKMLLIYHSLILRQAERQDAILLFLFGGKSTINNKIN